MVRIHQLDVRGSVEWEGQFFLVALRSANILEDDLDVVVRPALVALVFVVVDEPADVEARVASLARNPDVPRAEDSLVSRLDGLGVGQEMVVERVLEVRYHNESNDCPAGRAGARVLLQELGIYNQIGVSSVTFLHPLLDGKFLMTGSINRSSSCRGVLSVPRTRLSSHPASRYRVLDRTRQLPPHTGLAARK